MHSIIRNTRTNEHHIFKSYKNGEREHIDRESICQKCDQSDELQWVNGAKHLDEHTMRSVAARKGRDICGVCVSRFYANYKKGVNF